MDVTAASDERLQVGVELFLEGHSLLCEGVVFYKENERALQVDSYSEWAPERSTPDQAKDKIANAKLVLTHLASRSPLFAAAAKRLPHEHFFCYDYGNGSIALAKEINGKFEWLFSRS